MTLNARQLAMRDPARAALMGAIAGGDFGFGDDYGADMGDDMGFGYGGQGISAYDPSMNVGYGFGAAPAHHRRHIPAPHHPAHHGHHGHHGHHAHQVPWHESPHNPTSTAARTTLLDPNRDSVVKVQRYSFSFSPATNLVLGTASAIAPFTQQPSTSIKGQRVVMNAPVPGFVTVSTLQIANVNVFVGTGEDAFTYGAGAMGVMLDLPRLDPQNRATCAGSYSGVLPPGFAANTSFQFIVTLQGASTLAGGYGQ